jgi:glutamate-1-semialdehyde 2,1-aminomutase
MYNRKGLFMTYPSAQELYERSLRVAPGGVHSPVRAYKSVGGTPVFFESGEGAYLYSTDGKKYVDFCMSFGPLILGHRDPQVQLDVEAMIKKAWTFGACEPYSLALGEWLKEHVPHLEKLRFVSSGTEAVMSALRLARAATGRKKILKFHGCYHGHVDNLLVKAGSGLAGEAVSDSAGVSPETAQQTVVVSLNDLNGLDQAFKEHGPELAAVIVEPLPANYGLLPQTKIFFELLTCLCKQHSSLLIFDEVISGFRVSLGGMAHELNIKPDLVTYGKILGGGFPVGCYGGRADLMEMMAPVGPVYQAGTLSANPIGMVAGLSTLKKIKAVNGQVMINQRAQKWVNQLRKSFELENIPVGISQEYSLFWFYPKSTAKSQPKSVADCSPHVVAFYKIFFHELLSQGVYLAPNGYEVGFLSLAHTEELLSSLVPLFTQAAKKAGEIIVR